MFTRSAIFFPLVMAALLAMITYWISQTVEQQSVKIDGSSRHDPDYTMNNFVTTQTDITGKLRYVLAAAEMLHYPDDDSTVLQRPRYTQFATNKPYTQIEALRGYVSSDGEEVQLVDNVKVTRQAFAEKGEMTVETEYLNIRPNEELVRTQSPVVIRQAPKTVIYATGMIYEKKNRTVTLLHKVRAHYEYPAQPTSDIAKANMKNSNLKTETVSDTAPVVKAKPAVISTLKKHNPTTSNTKDARIRRRYE